MKAGRARLNEKMRRPLNGKPKRTYILMHTSGSMCTQQVGEKRGAKKCRVRGTPGLPDFRCKWNSLLVWQPVAK